MLSFLFLFNHERAHEVLPGSPPTGAFAKVLMAFHSSLTGVRVWRYNHLIIWNKKDVGVCLSVPTPVFRP